MKNIFGEKLKSLTIIKQSCLYCLMRNHFHLQIETGAINISQVMKRINMLYAIYFNKKYNFVGHLFQDRYCAELIETTPYDLEISRYIHLNPVRASIVERPDFYQWSRLSSLYGATAGPAYHRCCNGTGLLTPHEIIHN